MLSQQDKLFPYVRDNVEKWLNSNFDKAEVQKSIAALRAQVFSYFFP